VLRQLAARCRREIADPPRLAIPDVDRLGPVPETRAELDAYLKRLDAVGRAFDAVEGAYAGQLRERAELRYRLEGLHAKAESNGRGASPTVASGYLEAKSALEEVPCELALARFYVEQYEFLTRELPIVRSNSATTGQEGRAS
jgi:BMFP domain-containing protein YqiC